MVQMNLTGPNQQQGPALSSLRFAQGQALSAAKDQRSKASLCLSRQTLRYAQGDTVRLFKRSSTFLQIEPCLIFPVIRLIIGNGI